MYLAQGVPLGPLWLEHVWPCGKVSVDNFSKSHVSDTRTQCRSDTARCSRVGHGIPVRYAVSDISSRLRASMVFWDQIMSPESQSKPETSVAASRTYTRLTDMSN